jgi:DNA-binding transcriptional regulator LsrR (DeoR family)
MTEAGHLQNVHLAARLYYIDNLPQAEIARSLNVSQAKISRLLTEARTRGIVQISVADFDFHHAELEMRLVRELDLGSAVVIRTPAGSGSDELRNIVSHFAAPLVAKMIQPSFTVAVSGGRTLRDIAQRMPESDKHAVTVLPAMGSVRAQVGAVDAVEVGRAIANHCQAAVVTLNSPAFLPDKKTRDTFLTLEQLRSVRSRLSQSDLALIGIGTLSNSVFVQDEVLSKADVQKLEAAGVVGEICGRFFDKNGHECDNDWRDRVISIEFQQLRRIPNVTAIVVGWDRTAATAAAVRGRLIKSLITDECSARALLDFFTASSSSTKARKSK